uniref:Uncharacterized protein n=1 Tax=Pristionchus pacificus TaxID=54126 RepID=A0A2A6BF30_PRIPA|eukprot:PDM64489.1 hypothetical protein PRIPAC_52745 [Pristionchus pacificus]
MVDTTESVYYKRRSEIKENERKEERRFGNNRLLLVSPPHFLSIQPSMGREGDRRWKKEGGRW